MKSPFRKPLARALLFVAGFSFLTALGGGAHAGGGTRAEAPRAFHIEAAGVAYRLELEGSLAAAAGPFEARLFSLGRAAAAPQAPRADTTPPIVVSPIPYVPASAIHAGPPDAVWSVVPNGAITLVAIEVGSDRVEGALLADDTAKTVACWPEDPPPPLWVEINGVPLDVPAAMANLRFESKPPGKSDPKPDPESALLAEPRRFFREFSKLHGLVLAAIAPATVEVDRWVKTPCQGKCLACATGILRVTGMVGMTVTACSAVGVTAGASAGGCVLSMLFAHATVVDAGLRCAACDSCVGSQRDSSDHDCTCPCVGDPTCDCAAECASGGGAGNDGPIP